MSYSFVGFHSSFSEVSDCCVVSEKMFYFGVMPVDSLLTANDFVRIRSLVLITFLYLNPLLDRIDNLNQCPFPG